MSAVLSPHSGFFLGLLYKRLHGFCVWSVIAYSQIIKLRFITDPCHLYSGENKLTLSNMLPDSENVARLLSLCQHGKVHAGPVQFLTVIKV